MIRASRIASMRDAPFFSVITATYKRGNRIRPTIGSVLDQTEQDFEYLVVGDGCTDETESVVRSFGSDKIRWLNLPENRGNQSFANNHGIEAARGEWICYLGHDDIWSPDHLRSVRNLIEREPSLDFAIAGCAGWGPQDSSRLQVSGIFDSGEVIAWHFTPPSSVAHRRSVTEKIGAWSDPRTVAHLVDFEFFLRAFNAGMNFGSTQRVTAHKFSAGFRYLSYLRPSVAEQQAMLDALRKGTAPASDEIIAEAKRRDQFQKLVHILEPGCGPGELYLRTRRSKGLTLPPLRPLEKAAVIEPDNAPAGADWVYTGDEKQASRTSFLNPRPKLLIPYSGGPAHFDIAILKMPSFAPGQRLRVMVEDVEAVAVLKPRKAGGHWLSFLGRLSRDGYTVLTLLIAPPLESLVPRLELTAYGQVTIGEIRLRPLGLFRKLAAFWKR